MKTLFQLFLIWNLLFIHSKSEANDLFFRHLGVEDGLSQSWVKCITQDHDGLIWIGTSDGLNRYDGYDFKIYRSDIEDENTLIGNDISTLEADNQGNVWIGTTNGLTMFNPQKNLFYTHPSWPKDHINTICIEDSIIHVGGSHGVKHINIHSGKPDRRFRDFQNLGYQNINVSKICIDAIGRYWFSTNRGLFIIDLNRKTCEKIRLEIGENNSLDDYSVDQILFDHKGRLWIGTKKNGLLMSFIPEPKDKTIRVSRMGPDFEKDVHPRMLSVNLCNNNEVWCSLENYGLYIVKDLGGLHPTFDFQLVKASENSSKALSKNTVFSIFEDKTGGVWLGQYAGGISYYSPTQKPFMSIYSDENNTNSLINPVVNVIEELGNYFWFGTENGLSSYNSKTKRFQHYRSDYQNKNTLSSNSIWAILPLDNRRLLLGTWGGGVNILDTETGIVQRNVVKGLEIDNVFSLLESSKGEFWIGTMGQGILKCDKNFNIIKRYVSDFSDSMTISSDYIRKIIETSKGEIWISTSGGVDIYNESSETFQDLSGAHGKYNSGAYDLYEDSEGMLWLGTSMGLSKYNLSTDEITIYDSLHPEEIGPVKSIIEDDFGCIWFGSTNGIVKVDPRIYPDSNCVVKYDHYDGLGIEFNRRSVFKTKSGLLFFGTLNGVNYFNPLHINENKIVPNIIFTKLEVNNAIVDYRKEKRPIDTDINIADKVVLTNDQSVFSIHYSGLSYLIPEKNQYAYRLKGFNDEWNYVGTRRYASYTNLDPGIYHFEVKASNNDGVWNEQYRTLAIEILPAWWQTVLAYTLYVFLFITILIGILNLYRLRVNEKQDLLFDKYMSEKDQEHKQQQIQFYTNISHAFKNPLTLIIDNIEDIKRESNDNSGKINQYFNSLHRNSIRLLHLISELNDGQNLDSNKIDINFPQTEHSGNNKNDTFLSEEGLAGETQFFKGNDEVLSVEQPNKKTRYTVLIVEANSELRLYISSELKSDYEIIEAKDGNEGYKKAKINKPDCIICDMVMPASNGFNLSAKIRSDEFLGDTPIIILTARDTTGDRLKSATIGANLFGIKPFDVQLLKAQIDNLIQMRNKLMENTLVDQSHHTIDAQGENLADKDFVQKLTEYIYQHMSEHQIQVDDVAVGMSLSRSQLYRKIKTITGYSATEFIRNVRLERAREILMNKTMSVNEVSIEVGFNSSSYFTKCYKKYFGKLPSEEES